MESIVHILQKLSVKELKVRESFAENQNDTPGTVCIELLNDTPGIVDNDCAELMGTISAEKRRWEKGF